MVLQELCLRPFGGMVKVFHDAFGIVDCRAVAPSARQGAVRKIQTRPQQTEKKNASDYCPCSACLHRNILPPFFLTVQNQNSYD
jgi:hypothetical protein